MDDSTVFDEEPFHQEESVFDDDELFDDEASDDGISDGEDVDIFSDSDSVFEEYVDGSRSISSDSAAIRNVSETAGWKLQQKATETPTPTLTPAVTSTSTFTSHSNPFDSSSLKNSTSSLHKTRRVEEVQSTISLKVLTEWKTSTAIMTPAEVHIGEAVSSLDNEQEKEAIDNGEEFDRNEAETLGEQCHNEYVVRVNSHSSTQSKQSVAKPAVNNNGPSFTPVTRSAAQKVRLAVYTPKDPTTSTYKMAQQVSPNKYHCGWSNCDYHGSPHSLACHVLAQHPGSDWTLDGFKCEWNSCPARVRLHRGLHQHCLDVHIPQLDKPFWSPSLPPLSARPRHSREYQAWVGTIIDSDASKSKQSQHDATLGAAKSVQDDEEPERMVIDVAHERVVLRQGSISSFKSNSEPGNGLVNEAEPSPPSSPPVAGPTSLAISTPSRGGLRQYLPDFSRFSSPFTSYFSTGSKRKRVSDSQGSGDGKVDIDAEETPVKGNKRPKIAHRSRVVAKEKVHEMEMVVT